MAAQSARELVLKPDTGRGPPEDRTILPDLSPCSVRSRHLRRQRRGRSSLRWTTLTRPLLRLGQQLWLRRVRSRQCLLRLVQAVEFVLHKNFLIFLLLKARTRRKPRMIQSQRRLTRTRPIRTSFCRPSPGLPALSPLPLPRLISPTSELGSHEHGPGWWRNRRRRGQGMKI